MDKSRTWSDTCTISNHGAYHHNSLPTTIGRHSLFTPVLHKPGNMEVKRSLKSDFQMGYNSFILSYFPQVFHHHNLLPTKILDSTGCTAMEAGKITINDQYAPHGNLPNITHNHAAQFPPLTPSSLFLTYILTTYRSPLNAKLPCPWLPFGRSRYIRTPFTPANATRS